MDATEARQLCMKAREEIPVAAGLDPQQDWREIQLFWALVDAIGAPRIVRFLKVFNAIQQERQRRTPELVLESALFAKAREDGELCELPWERQKLSKELAQELYRALRKAWAGQPPNHLSPNEYRARVLGIV